MNSTKSALNADVRDCQISAIGTGIGTSSNQIRQAEQGRDGVYRLLHPKRLNLGRLSTHQAAVGVNSR